MITALANGLSGIAASPAGRHRTPVVADDHVASGRAGRVEHPQRVVHQRADVIAAVRGDRRRRVAAHERCHHPPPGVGQLRRDLAPAVGGVGKTVQAQRNRRRPAGPQVRPAAAPAGVATFDRLASGPRPGRTRRSASGPSTLSSVTRTLDAVSVGASVADDHGLVDEHQNHRLVRIGGHRRRLRHDGHRRDLLLLGAGDHHVVDQRGVLSPGSRRSAGRGRR